MTNYHTAICFSVVDGANGTVIENNNIHDCGTLPVTNNDHGIYVASDEHAIPTHRGSTYHAAASG